MRVTYKFPTSNIQNFSPSCKIEMFGEILHHPTTNSWIFLKIMFDENMWNIISNIIFL